VIEDLAHAAAAAARTALGSWKPEDPDSLDRLATAIGEAVAEGIARHEQDAARHTALAMAGLADEDDSLLNWHV
jgi:hypothetical protein